MAYEFVSLICLEGQVIGRIKSNAQGNWLHFANRSEIKISEAYPGETPSRKAIWFIAPYEETPDFDRFKPILSESKHPYVVCGWFDRPEMEMDYSREVDCYVAKRTTKEGVAKMGSCWAILGAEKILHGREVDIKKTSAFLSEVRGRERQEKIEEFMRLPAEEQRKKLEELLS
jgi:hypothetical protein